MNYRKRQVAFVASMLLVMAANGSGANEAVAKSRLGLTQTPSRFFSAEVTVNGVPVWLDVDTGSDGTVLDSSLARSLRLKSGARTRLFCVGGIVRARMTTATLKVPGYAAEGFSCMLASLNQVSRHAKDDPTRGILGSGFLRPAGAIVDFGNCTIKFGPDTYAKEPASEEMLAVPFDYVPAVGVTVPVRINCRKTMAVVDSGAVQTLVYADVALPNKCGRIKGTDGIPCTIVDQIEFLNERVGSVLIENTPAILLEKERLGVELYRAVGVPRVYIGLDVLRLTEARVDFRTQTLLLSKTARSVKW
jgi:predicted aspartyl protease